jgi:hypothetical protein
MRFAYTPLPEEDNRIALAVKLQEADVALVFAGWPEGMKEGHDRVNDQPPG